MILSGRNVGYVLDHLSRPYLESGRLRVLRPDITRRIDPIAAVSGPASSGFKLARRFVDCLVDVHMEPACDAGVAKISATSGGVGGAKDNVYGMKRRLR